MKTTLIITIISVLLAILGIFLFNQGCPQALILIAVIPFLYIIFCEDKDSMNYKRRKGIQ